MKRFLILGALAALAGCGTSQSVTYKGVAQRHTVASNVDVLYSPPQRSYTSIGTVSARKYQPGFVDPTITDARTEIQKAGADIGADAVIVRTSQAAPQTRLITVEGEAIRYTK